MTTELTKAAQQALEALTELLPDKKDPNHGGHDARDVRKWHALVERLRALTQRPAAQEVEHPPHRLCGCDACSPSFEDESNASLPAPQQATPGPHLFIGACITDGRLHATVQRLESNGNVTLVATAEMDAASLHGRDCMAQMTPATPEPVLSLSDDDQREWAGAVGLARQVTGLVPVKTQTLIAVARLLAATPEPVGEAIIGRWLYEKWWAEYGKLADVDKPYYTFDELPEKQRAAYESLALMLTHPAPGVPEGFADLLDEVECFLRTLRNYDGNPVPINKKSAMIRAIQRAAAQAK